MILGHFDNVERYRGFNEEIYLSLKYLKNVPSSVEKGIYPITDLSKLIVSEYETTPVGLGKFEAHRHVIDIQYPIIGEERIKWSPLSEMTAISEYDQLSDTTFYTNPSGQNECTIGGGVFAIFFPEDAHRPQLCGKAGKLKIKKLTVKVSF